MLALRLPADIEKRLADLAEKELRKVQRGARTYKLAEILREYGVARHRSEACR